MGTVLRSRKVQIKSIFDVHVEEAYQILYRTIYVHDDEPTTSVTTVMVPYNAKRDRLVVSGEFEDSNGPQCAPSYTYRAGITSDVTATVNMAASIPYLMEGYIVTVPDKEGGKGAFGSGFVEGHQTLDATRATLAFKPLKISKNVRIAGQGYSGGAIQTGWSAALKPTYAPELPFVGWYAGGPPSNLRSLILRINKGVFSAFIVGGLERLSSTYPKVQEFVDEVAKQPMLDALQFAKENCLVTDLIKYPFIDITDSKWTNRGDKVLDDPRLATVLDELVMGANKKYTPTEPVLIVTGKVDEICPHESVLNSCDMWCEHGAEIDVVRYETDVSYHFVTQITATARAFDWVRSRLEGKPRKPGCSQEVTHDVILDTHSLGDEFVSVLEMIDGFAGDYIGPRDNILANRIRAHQGSSPHRRRRAMES